MRPAHLHFLASKDGFKTLISQIYVQDDKFIDTDVQFGVTRHLIGNYVRHENETAAGARRQGRVVFARLHLRHGSGHDQAAAAADHRQGQRRAAEDSASGVREKRSRVPAKRAPIFSGSNAVLRASASRDPGPEQNALVCRLALDPGSRFARPGHEIRVRHLAPAAARSTEAAVWPNRIARSSGVRMPPILGLTAFAFP